MSEIVCPEPLEPTDSEKYQKKLEEKSQELGRLLVSKFKFTEQVANRVTVQAFRYALRFDAIVAELLLNPQVEEMYSYDGWLFGRRSKDGTPELLPIGMNFLIFFSEARLRDLNIFGDDSEIALLNYFEKEASHAILTLTAVKAKGA